ncbi:MAG: hypothetical protein J2P23_14335, partial [Microlunatus sp.]|nr:hypothetical protein [Microlunatus sp.]
MAEDDWSWEMPKRAQPRDGGAGGSEDPLRRPRRAAGGGDTSYDGGRDGSGQRAPFGNRPRDNNAFRDQLFGDQPSAAPPRASRSSQSGDSEAFRHQLFGDRGDDPFRDPFSGDQRRGNQPRRIPPRNPQQPGRDRRPPVTGPQPPFDDRQPPFGDQRQPYAPRPGSENLRPSPYDELRSLSDDPQPPYDDLPTSLGSRQEAYESRRAGYHRQQPYGGRRGYAGGRSMQQPYTSERAFYRTIVLTIVGAFIPGVGLIAGRRRVIGGIVLMGFLALVIGTVVWAAADPSSLVATVVNPRLLTVITIGLVVLGVIWVLVIIGSYLSLARGPLRRGQRFGASVLVAVLSFVIAAPVAVGARYSYDQAGLV